jgi:hypothetical protein
MAVVSCILQKSQTHLLLSLARSLAVQPALGRLLLRGDERVAHDVVGSVHAVLVTNAREGAQDRSVHCRSELVAVLVLDRVVGRVVGLAVGA